MKFLLVVLALIASVKSQNLQFLETVNRRPPMRRANSKENNDTVVEGWITQRLDNFDSLNNATFKMRYLVNDKYYEPGGPIFIYVGGEWKITPKDLRYGHMFDMTKALKGLMFYTEHRFYGKTKPTPELTLEDLQYLNVAQSLADLAHFITYVKQTFPGAQNSGVILVGCSYGASMVTWFMQKYPHLANGAWALGCPLAGHVEFSEYTEVVSKAIHKVGGEKCSGRIRRSFEQVEEMLANRKTEKLEKLFKLCHPLDLSNKLDIANFFSNISVPWYIIAQFSEKNNNTIARSCDKFTNIKADSDVEAYAEWITKNEYKTKCNDHTYQAFINDLSKTSWNSNSFYRAFFYQMCAEFGWFQTHKSKHSLFGNNYPIELLYQACSDLYGEIFTPDAIHRNIERTNIIYGGRNPNVRFVYITQGEYDPWAELGVKENINEDSPVVILPGASHCNDLKSIDKDDSPEMKASKERIFALAKKWLNIA